MTTIACPSQTILCKHSCKSLFYGSSQWFLAYLWVNQTVRDYWPGMQKFHCWIEWCSFPVKIGTYCPEERSHWWWSTVENLALPKLCSFLWLTEFLSWQSLMTLSTILFHPPLFYSLLKLLSVVYHPPAGFCFLIIVAKYHHPIVSTIFHFEPSF